MYNPRKRVEFDFAAEEFYRLSKNQKLAIINFLSVIAVSDQEEEIDKVVIAFMKHCYREFKIKGEEYLEYIAVGGREQTAADILSMKKENLIMLVMANAELCSLVGHTTEEQTLALLDWLEDMGMKFEDWEELLGGREKTITVI